MRENLTENHFPLCNQPRLIDAEIPIYTGDRVVMSFYMQAQLIYCVMRGHGYGDHLILGLPGHACIETAHRHRRAIALQAIICYLG